MVEILAAGALSKMQVALEDTVQYHLALGEQRIHLNPLIGRKICLQHTGAINCSHCGRRTKKSYSQGYCYPCFKKLPQCDLCMMSPDRCHRAAGTCRDEAWADQVCFSDHVVYLSCASGAKVGITRKGQQPTRWIDQGASQALPILAVATRPLAGKIERLLGEFVADKTDWRKMLKNQQPDIDLIELRDSLLERCSEQIAQLAAEQGEDSVRELTGASPLKIDYPVRQYPSKISAHNFDKTALVSGVLEGVKGQYLLLDSGVINIRKFTAYHIEFGLS